MYNTYNFLCKKQNISMDYRIWNRRETLALSGFYVIIHYIELF